MRTKNKINECNQVFNKEEIAKNLGISRTTLWRKTTNYQDLTEEQKERLEKLLEKTREIKRLKNQ